MQVIRSLRPLVILPSFFFLNKIQWVTYASVLSVMFVSLRPAMVQPAGMLSFAAEMLMFDIRHWTFQPPLTSTIVKHSLALNLAEGHKISRTQDLFFLVSNTLFNLPVWCGVEDNFKLTMVNFLRRLTESRDITCFTVNVPFVFRLGVMIDCTKLFYFACSFSDLASDSKPLDAREPIISQSSQPIQMECGMLLRRVGLMNPVLILSGLVSIQARKPYWHNFI